MNEVLRPCGITALQYNVLRILRGAGPNGWCGREISERLVSKVPDVSRLLDRMESLQLLRRERDATDRRHVTARITPKGVRVLERPPPRWNRPGAASTISTRSGCNTSLTGWRTFGPRCEFSWAEHML